jgi:hypothetical protein
VSGERKRRKECQEKGLEKEQSDKDIRLEERGERSEADLLVEGRTLAGTTTQQKRAFSVTSLLQETPGNASHVTGNASHVTLPVAFIF